jgi:hypothetical protein
LGQFVKVLCRFVLMHRLDQTQGIGLFRDESLFVPRLIGGNPQERAYEVHAGMSRGFLQRGRHIRQPGLAQEGNRPMKVKTRLIGKEGQGCVEVFFLVLRPEGVGGQTEMGLGQKLVGRRGGLGIALRVDKFQRLFCKVLG